MQKTILITGSDGLIGSNLSKYFLDKGHRVFGVDHQNRYGSLIREHHNHKNFLFLKKDLLGILEFDLPEKLNWIIHCAYEAGGINWWNHDEDNYYDRNRKISRCMINFLINRSQVEKVFWFSSSQVYENESLFPTPELEVGKLSPSSGYACEKLQSEKEILSNELKNKTVIVRPFNVIGKEEIFVEGNNRAHVVVDIANKIIRSKGRNYIDLQGNGAQTRSFTTIEDFIDAFRHLSQKTTYGIYNICGPQEISILELSKKMWSLKYQTPPIIRKDDQKINRDVERRIGCTKKIQNQTGWKAKNNLDQHLLDILNEVEKRLEI